MTWNERLFRLLIRGRTEGDGKAPERGTRIKDAAGISWDEAQGCQCFGGVMHENLIDISFDDPAMGDKFLDMAEVNDWRCIALENPKNRHIHTFWKNARKRITKKSGEDVTLAVGLIADIHGGNTYIPLRVFGVDRFPPVYDLQEGEDLQEVPDELIPVGTKIALWNLGEGDGRNDALSGMAKYLIHNTRFGEEQIRRVLTNANAFIFRQPLPDSEVRTILRDETFKDLDVPTLNTLNAAELAKMDIKPVEFIINGLLPVGLTILASPPKYGKSFMCMDMALSVAAGHSFLGFTTNQCGVLYLSLEDRYDRMKQRMIQITAGDTIPPALIVGTDCQTLGDGLIEQLEHHLNEHPTKLIIIDTFIKVRGEAKKNESAYAVDSREAGIIKKFADQHGIAVLLVTHTRKGIDPSDPFVNITGTYGVAGAADDMIVLTRDKRSDALTKMSVTGRDVTYEEYPLTFDKERGKWRKQGDDYDLAAVRYENEILWAEYRAGNLRKIILKLLDDNEGTWTGSCSAIIKAGLINGFPISSTAQTLGKELGRINGFLFKDRVSHTEIKNGTAAKIHRFERIAEEKT